MKSAEDIAAWIEERKRRFPTKERIAQKQKEEEERKRAREQAQAEKRLKYQTSETQTKKRKRKDGDGQDKAIRKAEKLREKLRKAEEAVAKAKGEYGSQNKDDTAPKRSLVINYDSEDSADQTGEETSSLNESSSEVSTDSDSDDSSSSDNDSDDNPPPEEESSAKRPLRVHLPNRKAPPTEAPRPRQDRHKQEPKRMTLRERVSKLFSCIFDYGLNVNVETNRCLNSSVGRRRSSHYELSNFWGRVECWAEWRDMRESKQAEEGNCPAEAEAPVIKHRNPGQIRGQSLPHNKNGG